MEKRASEDKVFFNNDSYKRCKECGAVENEFLFDREQPEFMYSNNQIAEDNDWGMDYTNYEDMGMDGDYITREDMDVPGMYPEQMTMNQMDMPHMEMPQMNYMDMPPMEMNPMDMENMYYGMPEMNDPYFEREMNTENQMVPGMDYQHIDQLFQIIGQMLEEIINREARIMKLIEELKDNRMY